MSLVVQQTLDLIATDTPVVMGILNVTPDSFSDGGQFADVDSANRHALQMIDQGAHIIDIGGESTRPGAEPVSVEQECERVIPVIEAIRIHSDIPISIDTSKPEVMREAVAAGASMVNDVNALRSPGAVEACAELQVPVCLMHMQGEPRTMQQSPHYMDVVAEVRQFLLERANICERGGISHRAIVLDPGFGFGKTLDHNLTLFTGLDRLCELNYPLLAGISRKSMLGAILDRKGADNPESRVIASVTAAVMAWQKGVRWFRVHDVQQTVDAFSFVNRIEALEN